MNENQQRSLTMNKMSKYQPIQLSKYQQVSDTNTWRWPSCSSKWVRTMWILCENALHGPQKLPAKRRQRWNNQLKRWVNTYQQITIHINIYQYISTNIISYQQIYSNINKYVCVSTNIHIYKTELQIYTQIKKRHKLWTPITINTKENQRSHHINAYTKRGHRGHRFRYS